MNICKANYEDSLLQVANSMREFVQLKPYHSTSDAIQNWLVKKDIHQVVLLVIDGMGYHQIQTILKEEDFFCKYCDHPIETVMPSTTVAATMCLRTGHTPAESRYLGWHQYQSDLQDSLTMFHSQSYYQENVHYPNYIAKKYPYQTIVDEASAQGILACELFPYWCGSDIYSVDDLCKATRIALEQGHRYVYSYWDGYDAYMHRNGVYTSSSKEMLKEIEKSVAQMAATLPQHCGVIVVADHGHVDVKACSLCAYPNLLKCFKRKPTLEMRCVNFYIKEGYGEQFSSLFLSYFKDCFKLYTHQEAIDEKLFGNLKDDSTWCDEIGDFIAIATADIMLTFDEDYADQIKGNHAGMSESEMMVPLILFPV